MLKNLSVNLFKIYRLVLYVQLYTVFKFPGFFISVNFDIERSSFIRQIIFSIE